MVETHHPDGALENPAVRHEPTDASFRWILGIGITSIVGAVILHVALLWFLQSYEKSQARVKRSSFPLAAEQREQLSPGPGHALNGGPLAGQREPLPPEPRLDPLNVREGVPNANVSEMYRRDEEVLHSYGPGDEKGFVRIPVDRAMTLLADKLPARKEQPADKNREHGLRDWGESNSGRMYRGERR